MSSCECLPATGGESDFGDVGFRVPRVGNMAPLRGLCGNICGRGAHVGAVVVEVQLEHVKEAGHGGGKSGHRNTGEGERAGRE